jgi:hypothetical protein
MLSLAILVAAQNDDRSLEERLQEVNLKEARTWEMYLDAAHTIKAAQVEHPVYLWTNPTKNGGQHGSVFVWVHRGRPVAVGSIFAHPTQGKRKLVHEFHSLSQDDLFPASSDGAAETWSPKAPIRLQPIPGAPAVESSPARRLLQMRSLAREFGGYTVDWRKQRWELRLLPQPLYRYENLEGDVIDGALMALVTDAGTDPEVLLLMEANRDDGWRCAVLRFSDSSLYATHRGKEIWSSVRGDPENTQFHNPDHTYRVLHKRFLDDSFNPIASADQ